MTSAAPTVELAGRPVHRMGFGAMQLPGPGVYGPPRDRDAALAVLRRAVELGVDHIDTAQFYGPDVSNELIREALHPYPASLVLVSKVGARRDNRKRWLPAQQPDELVSAVEDNLRTLGVEQLGAVNLRRHEEDHSVPLDDQLAALVALRDAGKIGGIGLSNVGADDVEQALAGTDIVCVQNAYNLRQRDDQPVLDLCSEHGIPYVPFFPLGSGFPGAKRVTDDPAVTSVASRLGATPAQVGLAWLLAQYEGLLLIPGTSNVDHLVENMGAATVTLDDDALAELG